MKKFIEKIVSWLYGVKPGLLYSFIIGLLVAVFCLVVAKMYVCFWPALMLALILAFAKMWVKETSSPAKSPTPNTWKCEGACSSVAGLLSTGRGSRNCRKLL